MESLPEDINKWNIGTVTNLLHSGYYESDTLEFKENLNSENDRITRTCCSFANANGGVIVFGVVDDRTKDPFERIIGLDMADDNIVTITNFVKKINPQLSSNYIQFGIPPIDLKNNRELILLQIKKSNVLHQFEDKFYQRLHGKNGFMPYDQIKSKFIDNRKNRRVINLLADELAITKLNYQNMEKYTKDVYVLASIDCGKKNPTDTLYNFTFNHSYLYSEKAQKLCTELLEVISKTKDFDEEYATFKTASPKFQKEHLEEVKCKSNEEYIIKMGNYFAKIALKHISDLESELKLTLPKWKSNKYDVFGTEKKS